VVLELASLSPFDETQSSAGDAPVLGAHGTRSLTEL